MIIKTFSNLFHKNNDNEIITRLSIIITVLYFSVVLYSQRTFPAFQKHFNRVIYID